MKFLWSLALVAALSGTACVHPNQALTPQAQVAVTVQQVIQRIGELQQATIDASDANRIPVATARAIVTQTNAVLKALAGPPADWATVARQFWVAERPVVATIPALAPYLATLDTLIGGQ